MKDWFLKKNINIIKDYNPNFSDEKLDEIKYGLEALYLSITKTIVILTICFILGIIKESLILLFFFNFLRITGFGLHATKSWMCWISSSITFIGIPFICKYTYFPKIILFIISLICILCFYLYAPADTVKRPLIRKKKRKIYKTITVITGIIYSLLIISFNNQILNNSLLFSMIIESILIHPFTYKIFNLSYNNYINYVLVNNIKEEI